MGKRVPGRPLPPMRRWWPEAGDEQDDLGHTVRIKRGEAFLKEMWRRGKWCFPLTPPPSLLTFLLGSIELPRGGRFRRLILWV